MQQSQLASADSSNDFSSIVAAAPGSDLAFEAVLGRFERQIRAVANSRRRRGVDVTDLEQSARIALWRSTFSYNAHRGPFHNYARQAIKHAVFTENTLRQPLTDEGEVVTEILGAAADDVPDDAVVEPADPFVVTRIRAWVQSLREPLQRIYALIYQQGLSQREVGRVLGVSQPRVAELHAELLERGRGALSDLAA